MGKSEKVLVCITPQSNSQRLINKGYHICENHNAELHILHVSKGNDILSIEETPKILQELFDYARHLGASVHGVCGTEILTTIKDFINKNKITYVVFGEPPKEAENVKSMVYIIKEIFENINIVILKRDEKVPKVTIN